MKIDLITQLNEQKRKVDFNSYDISVKELISMVRDDIINIAPEYQRQFRWKEDRQSVLIESIFLGIPIPSLFMATNIDGSWELIDGVQRLSSIIHFAGDEEIRRKIQMTSELKLVTLKKLTTLNDSTFLSLPRSIQLDFLLKPLKITTLSDKSDLQVRFDLFERLNTGGIILSNQEIRSCVYRGKFNDFLKSLVLNDDFINVVKLTSAEEADGTREEYVLRFFAFSNNYQNFDHSVVDFLNKYMEAATKKFDYDREEKVFQKTFRQLSALPHGITRKRNTTPANLFEGVAVGAALAIKDGRNLDVTNAETWIASEELRSYTTGATNSKKNVVSRIEYCKKKFLGQ
jgi:uncharacterized protein with ParB-like and HNH nuclease domain